MQAILSVLYLGYGHSGLGCGGEVMAKCPVCGSKEGTHWTRGLVIGLLIGALVAGWVSHYISYCEFRELFFHRIERLEEKNSELKEGYVPPREGRK